MRSTDNSEAKPISIVIVDASAISSELLKHAFEQQPGYEVVGCARAIDEAAGIATNMRPDIAIISPAIDGRPFSALAVLEEFSRIGSLVRAVVISSSLADVEAASYLRAHARGVLSAGETNFATLRECITCVHAGQIWAQSGHLACLVDAVSKTKSMRVVNARGEPILSMREEEVLNLLATGLTNRDLASTLKLSEHTVKNHLFRIFDKLGVSSRIEAVLYAMNHRETATHSARPSFPVQDISTRRSQLMEWQSPRAARVAAMQQDARAVVRGTFNLHRDPLPNKAG